jgi:hypothetical protein
MLSASDSTSFGDRTLGLSSATLGGSTQNGPLRFGAGAVDNKGSLAGLQAYRNYRMGYLTGGGTSSREFGRFGPVRLSMSATAATTFDSNINSSPDNPLSDIYGTVSLDIGLHWRPTIRNELHLNLGLSYTQYLRYTQYNQSGLFLSPQTGLDYRFYFLDFVLTLYDYPTITSNGGNQNPALTNTVNFRQLNNRGGLSLLWHPNELIFLVGLERADTLSLTNDEFSSQNSTSYSLYGVVSYDVTPTTNVGIRVQATSTEYAETVLNDSVFTTAGVFYQSRLTDYTSIYVEAGVQTGEFTNTGTQTSELVFQSENGFNTNVEGTLGGSDFVQPYFEIQVLNRLTRYLTHSLNIRRLASGSTVSDYTETNSITYDLQYRLNRFTTVGTSLGYEFGTVSRASDPAPYSNFTGQLDVGFQILSNTSLGVSYSYIQNILDDLNATYNRQTVSFFVSHSF